MLQIKQAQWDEIQRLTFIKTRKNLLHHLKQHYPEQTTAIGDEAMQSLISNGIERAEGYGITDQGDVTRFLQYLVEYGEGFGQSADSQWAAQFLNDENLSGTEIMNQIDDHELFVIALAQPTGGDNGQS